MSHKVEFNQVFMATRKEKENNVSWARGEYMF